MADENYGYNPPLSDSSEEEKKRALEEFQRQQAAAAVEASRNQPNAIPNEPVNAVDRIQNVVGNPANPQGYFIDRGQANLGPTGQIPPAGAVGIQGAPLSQDDQAFWQANPNGAVKDPQTGMLIGLGAHNLPRPEAQPALDYYNRNSGITARQVPGVGFVPFSDTRQQPRMVTPADLYNPQIKAQMDNLDREIATRTDALRRASTQRIGKNQPSQHEVLSDELKHLQYSRNVLGDEYHRNAANSFDVMQANQKRERETSNVNAGAEIAQWMSGLPRDPIARNQAWEQELAKPERLNWIEAINGHRGVRDFVKDALTGHQTVAEQQAAIQAAAGGRDVTLKGGSVKTPNFTVSPTLGESLTAQSQKDIIKSLSDAGVTSEQFAQRTKVEQGNIAKDASGKETFTNDNEGTHMRVTISDHAFVVPVGRYNQLNTAIPATQTQPAAQPSATPVTEVQRTTKDGRQAIFDAQTKKFLRYAQ